MLRHQLPAYSPVSVGILLGALGDRLTGSDSHVRLERLLREELSADYILLLDSGRSALQLALAMSARDGSKDNVVALPAFQCFEVGAAAVGAGCRIEFYDLDPATLTPDLDSLRTTLARGANAIVVAPLYGIPVDWDGVTDLAQSYGAMVIEDAAQGYGASWKGRPLGSLGGVSVVSFGRGKGWTGGGGGALCLRRDGDRAAVNDAPTPQLSASRELALIGAAIAQCVLGRPSLYWLPALVPGLELGETHYHAPTTPARAARFAAALANRAFGMSRAEASARRRAAAIWTAELPHNLLAAMVRVVPGAEAGFLRFPLRIADGARWLRSNGDARRLGIAPSYPRPLYEVPEIARNANAPRRDLTGAQCLARELVTLPTHSRLSAKDRDAILAICGTLEAPS